MFSFKQFLNEKWGRGMPGFPGLGMFAKTVHHHSNVMGHDVHVTFTPKDKHTAIDFMVNHHFDTNNANASHGQELLKHVHTVINNYIAKKKPKAVSLYPNHPSKNAAYKSYAHMLAKRHGGTVRELGLKTGMYHVEFNHGKESDS